MQSLTRDQTSFLIKRATYASTSVAVFLILIKFGAWIITDSVSLQASLVDSLLDGLASFINLIAVRQALRPADSEHRFGHGKIEAVAALGQSGFIVASGLWLAFESIHRFIHPQPIERSHLGIVVMLVAVFLTSLLVYYQNYVVRLTHSTAIKADSVHYRSDLLINLSVIVALLSAHYLHINILDPLIGAGIAFYILYTAWTIIFEAFHMLIDREWPESEREKIKKIVLSHKKVKGFHDLRTRSSGTYSFIQLHLELDGSVKLDEAHEISEEVLINLNKEFPKAEVMIHQDPYGLEEIHRPHF